MKFPFPVKPLGQRCRSPCGERGLKLWLPSRARTLPGRSPCGERGLKCAGWDYNDLLTKSLPVRGAWIEIYQLGNIRKANRVAPRAGSVD